MGVLSCSRSNCENIMCDTYIPTMGYICNECKEEFEGLMGTNSHYSKEVIESKLEMFLETEKEEYVDLSNNNSDEISVYDYFEIYSDYE